MPAGSVRASSSGSPRPPSTGPLHDQIAERLTAIGHRYTRGRRVLVETLVLADGPLTLPALLALAPKLTQSSAYRNLATMEEAGVVRRLVHSDGHAHFELEEDLTEHHHHLICGGCGVIVDVTLDRRTERALMAALDKSADYRGFRIARHQLDAFGLCATCIG